MTSQNRRRSTAPRETRADLQLLLECLNCQMYEPEAVKQSLLGIGSLCTSTPVAKDMLRDDGGLQFVFKLLTETSDVEVQEAAMYTLGCAVENNVYSQKQLTTGAVFGFLRTVLREPQLTARLQRTACFLLLSLVTNNSQGQTMIRTSGCLDVLLNMFKRCLPEEGDAALRGKDIDQTWFEDLTAGRSLEVWAAAASTICGCLNNPQNDENQRLCAAVFPQAFVFLQEQTSVEVIRSIMSLIGLATANNYHNQMRVQTAGGVRVLMSALHRAVNRLSDPDHQLLAISIASTIDTFVADNKKIAEECGQLGLVVLLTQLLRCPNLTADTLLPLVISLGHLLEASVVYQRQFVESGGLNILISTLTESEDAELSRAIKYILQGCVDTAREMKSRPNDNDQQAQGQTRPTSPAEETLATEKLILQKLAALERRLSDEVVPPSVGSCDLPPPNRGLPGLMPYSGAFGGAMPSGSGFRDMAPSGGGTMPTVSGFRDLPASGELRNMLGGGGFSNMPGGSGFMGMAPPVRGAVPPSGEFGGPMPTGDGFRDMPGNGGFKDIPAGGGFMGMAPPVRGAVPPSGEFVGAMPTGGFRDMPGNGGFKDIPAGGEFRGMAPPVRGAVPPIGEFGGAMPTVGGFRDMPSSCGFREMAPTGRGTMPPACGFQDMAPRGGGMVPPSGYFQEALAPNGPAGPSVPSSGGFGQLAPPSGRFGGMPPHSGGFRNVVPPPGVLRGVISPNGGSRDVASPSGNNEGAVPPNLNTSDLSASYDEWWTNQPLQPVPETHVHKTSQLQETAARLETELDKERSLRRSLEAKATSMEQELKERQRADRTAALTTELLKQTNVNKKKAQVIQKKPVRRAASRAPLGGSQHITTDSSESSPDLTMAPSTPRVTHTRQTTRPQQESNPKRRTQGSGPSQGSKGRNERGVKSQERSKLNLPQQKTPPERTEGKVARSVGVGDTQSVSIGMQTEDQQEESCITDHITTPQQNTPATLLRCHSVGVQTPSCGPGPVLSAACMEKEAVSTRNNMGSVSQDLQPEDKSGSPNEPPCLEKPSKTVSCSGNDQKEFVDPAATGTEPKTQNLEEPHPTRKPCSVVLQPQSKVLMMPSEPIHKDTFTSPQKRQILTPRRNGPPHPRTPIRLNRHSFSSPGRHAYPPPQSLVAPPSPCPSEFDYQLLQAANPQPGPVQTSLSAYSPSYSPGPRSGPRRGRPGTPITRRYSTRQAQRTPVKASSTQPPGTPVNVATMRPPLTYGRTSTSTRSLSMILTENHREEEERVPHEDGDGPSDTSGDARSEKSDGSAVSALSDSLMRQRAGNTKCPACQPPEMLKGPLLNSRTYNFALETNGFTCRLHRLIRAAERDLLVGCDSGRRSEKAEGRLLRGLSKASHGRDQHTGVKVYDFTSSDSDGQNPRSLSPPAPESATPVISPNRFYRRGSSSNGERRQRVAYSDQEVQTLLEAVKRQGRAWTSILSQNSFHPSRNATDLKDKYKQLMKAEAVSSAVIQGQKPRQPFSMAEERRLRRGVKQYGYNWKVIFDAFRFAPGRRPQDLRHKWKGLHRVH